MRKAKVSLERKRRGGVAPKYFIETFGCQMNEHDAERLAGLLESEGYERAAADRSADLVVVNTCSVRERAEEKLYTRLGELRVMSRERGWAPVIAVTGCVAQQEGEALLRRGLPIDVIVGTQSLKRLPELVARARESGRTAIDVNPYEDVSFPLGMVRHSDPVRSWVTIIEGCNEFCAFCVVPYTRGHERMRPARDILAEVEHAARSGHVEVQLLGQIVNHYQAPDDAGCDFASLLERVSLVPGIRRIRFASPHPRHVSDRLIAVLRDNPIVCKQLHLPLQSGSTRVLATMRRRHTREEYLELIGRLQSSVPNIALSTDLIVGFPGEAERDFEDTMDVVRQVRFQSIYSFKYSPRPQTLADKRFKDDVPEREKTRRIVELQAVQREIQLSRHTQMIGQVEDVLVDSMSRRRSDEVAGRTGGNAIVNLPGSPTWIGRILPVRIVEAAPNSLRGAVTVAMEPEAERAH
jgi:tRNA-2-methylthio-N6-dimethylallyladenosine synthase